MNIQGFRNNNFTVGNTARREALRNGGNTTTDRMRLSQRLTPVDYHGSLKALAEMEAYKIDGTLLEADRYRLDFINQLRDGNDGDNFNAGETQARLERLRSEIKENYKGDGRDMRLAALDAAVGFVNNLHSQRSYQNELLWRDIRAQLTGGVPIINSSIEEVLERFERLHAEIMENYEGAERDRRLAFLELAFEEIGDYHATSLALRIMNTAGISGAQFGIEGSRRVKAWLDTSDGIMNHINDMFRSALNHFRTNGSFSGFEDTEAANRPGQLSFRDITIITSDRLQTADDSDLSESGRDFLYSIMNRDFLNGQVNQPHKHFTDAGSLSRTMREALPTHSTRNELSSEEDLIQYLEIWEREPLDLEVWNQMVRERQMESAKISNRLNRLDYTNLSERDMARLVNFAASEASRVEGRAEGSSTPRDFRSMVQFVEEQLRKIDNNLDISDERRAVERQIWEEALVRASSWHMSRQRVSSGEFILPADRETLKNSMQNAVGFAFDVINNLSGFTNDERLQQQIVYGMEAMLEVERVIHSQAYWWFRAADMGDSETVASNAKNEFRETLGEFLEQLRERISEIGRTSILAQGGFNTRISRGWF